MALSNSMVAAARLFGSRSRQSSLPDCLATMTLKTLVAVAYGPSPVNMWYKVAPSAKMSARLSTFWPVQLFRSGVSDCAKQRAGRGQTSQVQAVEL